MFDEEFMIMNVWLRFSKWRKRDLEVNKEIKIK